MEWGSEAWSHCSLGPDQGLDLWLGRGMWEIPTIGASLRPGLCQEYDKYPHVRDSHGETLNWWNSPCFWRACNYLCNSGPTILPTPSHRHQRCNAAPENSFIDTGRCACRTDIAYCFSLLSPSCQSGSSERLS